MKRDAFELIRDIAANLSIHKSVQARAKEEYDPSLTDCSVYLQQVR
jgi:hypothetical protein